MSEAGIERAQRFESEHGQRAAALRFAWEVVETRGQPSDEALDEVRNAGYTDEQIIEMVATVALTSFTNHMNDFMRTEVDLPVKEPTDGGWTRDRRAAASCLHTKPRNGGGST